MTESEALDLATEALERLHDDWDDHFGSSPATRDESNCIAWTLGYIDADDSTYSLVTAEEITKIDLFSVGLSTREIAQLHIDALNDQSPLTRPKGT